MVLKDPYAISDIPTMWKKRGTKAVKDDQELFQQATVLY